MLAVISDEQRLNDLIGGVPLEEVDKLKYLEPMFIADGQCTVEIT